MKSGFSIFFFSILTFCAMSGPPVFSINSRTVSVAGNYSYEAQNRGVKHGTLELQLRFASLPDSTNLTPTFGDTSYSVSAVTFTIDEKPQEFPVMLLKELGYCSPTSVFLWSDDSPTGLLMTIDFSSGAGKKALTFRVHKNAIHPKESK